MLNKAIINLVNLRKNAKTIKGLLKDNVKFCAVVKADGYGHGASECANAIYDIVDCFAVALVEEGISLRYSGIKKDILVLVPTTKYDVAKGIENNLTLTVQDIDGLKRIIKTAKRLKKSVKIHIKYNSGMNRLGVSDIAELEEMLIILAKSEYVILDGFYTHFSKPQDKKLLNVAIDKFLLALKTVKRYNNKVTAHASASGGLLSGYQFDMVRIGIMLYGYTPYKTDRVTLKKVMRVYAPVVIKRKLKRGEGCLYGDKKVSSDLNVSIVRYGYADGFFRAENNSQYNNKCMDLTAIKGDKTKKFVCVMDDADKLAKKYNTISYEILVSATNRAERVYIR